jgi:hypothetical protein
MKRMLLLVAAAVLVAVPSTALARTSAMHPELSAKLLGKTEVPKGSPTAHGIVNLDLKAAGGKVCWTFDIAGVRKPTAAHIHKASIGKAGPVVVPLGAAYKAKGCTKAPTKMIEAIEAHPNAYYVNVHNAQYPAGAIRGQLVVGMMHM